MKCILPLLTAICWLAATDVRADDWYRWRGPSENGVSTETNLPDRFSTDPQDSDSNLIWKIPYGGRSTPVVMNGRVYLIRDIGEGINEQESVLCVDADTGKVLWEHKFNVFFTDIVSVRVGWTQVVGDPETGNVYAQGVQGLLFCFDKDGKVLWSHSLTEEYGRISGYGGRVASPMVEGDLVIVGMLNASWGEYARGGCRFVAFDKRTGHIVWWGDTGYQPKDTYYSTPVAATINGTRLIISGSGDGGVHAFKAGTGEKVWSYIFGAGAVNCAPVVEGNLVYIGHGEDNIDRNVQGRFICLDASQVENGKPKLVWERFGIKDKFCSPLLHEGRLYVCDEVAKMYCLDAKTGKTLWTKVYGRNAKGSPVWADGKIYIAAVNSQFRILKPGDKSCEILFTPEFHSQGGADVEINGSPAVANGRIYFMTSQELYCIGKKTEKATHANFNAVAEVVGGPGKPTHLQVIPAEVTLQPGEKTSFKARLFDEHGRLLREVKAEWQTAPMLPPAAAIGGPPLSKSAPGAAGPPVLQGTINAEGELTVNKTPPGQFGGVIATAEGLSGRARVRVAPVLPLKADFSKVPVGRTPGGWVNTQGKFAIKEKDGRHVLVKVATVPSPLVARAHAFMGMPTLTNYTIQADLRGAQKRADLPDMGIVANRYTLMLFGNTQSLRLVSWEAVPRVDKTIAFPWQPGVWYTMKLTVDVQGDKAVIRGKVWRHEVEEPPDWTVEFTDPTPNREGSPALYGYAAGVEGPEDPGTEIDYDNVSVVPNNK
jgi:outer membrane protein assembly factor BamB